MACGGLILSQTHLGGWASPGLPAVVEPWVLGPSVGGTVWPVPWLSLDSCVAPTTARFVLYFVLDSSALCPQQHNGLREHGSQAHRQAAFLDRPVPSRPVGGRGGTAATPRSPKSRASSLQPAPPWG